MNTDNYNNTQSHEKDPSFTLADLWDMVWNYKWWYVAFVAVCVLSVLLYIYRTPAEYVRTAKVIIDESEQDATMRSLGAIAGGAMAVRSNASVVNEMEAFSSPDLMQMVVRRLSLETRYVEDQFLRDVELYDSPVVMKLLADNPQSGFSYKIHKMSDDKVAITDFRVGKDRLEGKVECSLGDTVMTPVGLIALYPTSRIQSFRKDIRVIWNNSLTIAKDYCNRLRVSLSNRESTVVVISLEDTYPQRASDIISTLIDIYNEEWVRNKNRSARNTSEFINERLVIIEKELGGIEGEIKDFKQDNKLTNVNAVAQSYLEESSEYASKSFEINNQLEVARFIKDYLNDPVNENSLIPANLGLSSANVESQIKEYNDLVLQRDRLKSGSGDRNPMIADLNAALSSLRSAVLRSIDNLVTSLDLQSQKINSQEQQILSRIASNSGQELELLSIQRQQQVKESLYIFLLEKREENELAALVNVGNTRLIMNPTGSPHPVAPDKLMLVLVACIVGFGLPFTIIFLMNILDTTIKTKADLGQLSVPFLAEIPLSAKRDKFGLVKKSEKFNNANCKIIVEQGKRDMMNEAFRVFRTNLDMIIENKDGNGYVTMFTSFNPNAGKTFVIQNIAASMALKGAEVLLLDLDLRKATLGKSIGKNHNGVSSFLNGKESDYHDMIAKISDNLYILPVGTLPPNPTELLLTDRFKDMMESIRKEYDYIFIDCPPIDVVADTAIITKYVDMSVFVIRSGFLDKKAGPMIDALYKSRKYTRMVMILNGTDAENKSLRRYGYGYGYGYGN